MTLPWAYFCYFVLVQNGSILFFGMTRLAFGKLFSAEIYWASGENGVCLNSRHSFDVSIDRDGLFILDELKAPDRSIFIGDEELFRTGFS